MELLDEAGLYTDRLQRLYGSLVASFREEAKELGYDVGIQGEPWMIIDLILVPRAESASDPKTLVRALRRVAEGVTGKGHLPQHEDRREWWDEGRPGGMPHGLLAWEIHIGDGAGGRGGVVNLHVVPRAVTPKGGI